MRKLIYSMSATLDGYIAARGDDIGWSVPSAELHQWFNDRAREIGVSLYGRKLWEDERVLADRRSSARWTPG